MTEARAVSQPEETNVPILVRYGNTTLDFGMANIPKVFLRYYTYLRHGEFKLLDAEAMMLVEVIGLYGKAEDGDDYELRTRNLPMATSDIVRERYMVKFRRMGLVFTERLYFPGYPSRLKAIRWDMRPLFFNLEQVAERWRMAQRALLHTWHNTGAVGHRPVYAFPEDYSHAITLPLDVALDLVKGVFWPTTEEWAGIAAALCAQFGGPNAGSASTLPKESGTDVTAVKTAGSLSTLPKESGTGTQPKESGTASTLPKESGTSTQPKESGTGSTLPNESGHLIKTLNGGGGGGANPLAQNDSTEDQEVFDHFVARLGQPHAFSEKETKALTGLRAAGYSQTEILAGIDQAFDRSGGCRHFTFVAARMRNNPPAAQPEAQSPEGRRQPAPARKPETGASAEAGAMTQEVPPELTEVARILKEHGETLTSAKLARLKRMAQAYETAAARYGATSAAWLEQAMTQGLGEAKSSLIGFADTILRRWAEHGPDPVVEKTRPEAGPGNGSAGEHKVAGRKPTANERIARTQEALKNYRRPNGL